MKMVVGAIRESPLREIGRGLFSESRIAEFNGMGLSLIMILVLSGESDCPAILRA